MTEWNAASYHKVSAPQTSWGQKVLDRLLRQRRRARDRRRLWQRPRHRRVDGAAAKRTSDRDRSLLEHVDDRARKPAARARLSRVVRAGLAAGPAVRRAGPTSCSAPRPSTGSRITTRSSPASSRRCDRAGVCTRNAEAGPTCATRASWRRAS